MLSKGKAEAEVGAAIMKFEKEYFGRGPQDIQTYIIDDMILVRQRGVLTLAEQQLVDNPDGVELIQRLRDKLVKTNSRLLSALIEETVECSVIGIHTDINVALSEKIMVFSLNENLERRFYKGKRKAGNY